MSSFDDIIKQKADGHEAPVPPGAWEKIVRKKRKHRFGFFWWTAAILLLCGLGTTWRFNMQETRNNTITALDKTAIKPLAIKDKNIENKKQGTSSAVADSKGEKMVVDNRSITNRETLLNQQAATNAKTNTSQQSANKVLQNNSTSAGQGDITVLNKDEASKQKNQTAVLRNPKLVKNIKGKATYQIKGEATEEENKSAQNKKIADRIKVKISKIEIDENTSDVSKSEALSKPNKTEKLLEAKHSKALSFEEGLGEVKQNTTANNINADDNPTKQLPIKDNPGTLDKKQTATTENKTNAAEKDKQSKKKHWFLEIAATPLLPIQQYYQPASFNRTTSTANAASTFTGKLINTSIEPAVAFSLAVRKNINTKTSIGIGLQYLQLKENIDLSGIETHTIYSIVNRLVNGTNGPELISDTVQTVTEGTRKITATNSYTLYSLPIFAQYNFVQKTSWSAGITGGVFVNIFSQYKNEINQNAPAPLTTTPQNSKTNNIGLDVYAGLRFGKMLGKKIEFFALPSMRFGLKGYNVKNSLVNKKIQQAGVSFGLSFKIK